MLMFAPSAQSILSAPLRCMLALALAGCDLGEDGGETSGDTSPAGDPCENDDQGDTYAVGLSRTGESVTVEFVDALPAPPRKGNNAWHLLVTDVSGLPVEGVQWDVVPEMLAHGHGSNIAVVSEPMADAAGHYMLDPVNMHMAGLWDVTMDLTLPDATTDTVVFKFCIDP